MTAPYTLLTKLFHESLRLPVIWLHADDPSDEIQYGKVPTVPFPAAYNTDQWKQLVARTAGKTVPIIQTNEFLEQFLVLPVHEERQLIGTLVIGPTIAYHSADESLTLLLKDQQISSKHHSNWIAYLRSLPLVPRHQLFHIGLLAHWTANREALELTDILEQNFLMNPRILSHENVKIALSNMNELSVFHSDAKVDQMLFDLIKKGDKSGLKQWLVAASMQEGGVLSKRSHLRSRKNLAICAIAVAVRAAIEGGLYSEVAYRLSDIYIQHVEDDLQDIPAIDRVMLDAMIDLADQVSEFRRNRVSKPIALCQTYIQHHLYESFHLSELADHTGMNSNYLSQRFKKETGLTISSYIQQQRIEEAKKLLDFTEESISNIAARLNYYDQTHFIKSFKKYAGTTPKKYRDRRGEQRPI